MEKKFVAVSVIGELNSAKVRLPLYSDEDLLSVKEFLSKMGLNFDSPKSLQDQLAKLDEPVAIYGHDVWVSKLKDELFGKQ